MTDQTPAGTPHTAVEPTLADDLLLVLFDPESRTIAGETTLYYALAGAVLAELALADRVETRAGGLGTLRVSATGAAPTDPVLHEAWQYVAEKPRGVQTVLAAIGPELRSTLLDRLVERGDLVRRERKLLGLIPTTAHELGETGRRAALIDTLRPVFTGEHGTGDDGSDGADERTIALAAVLAASGSVPQLYREIPWNGTVATRVQQLQHGEWPAGAVAKAVLRTTLAITAGAAAAVVAASTTSTN